MREPLRTDEFEDVRARLSNWGRWGPHDQLGTINYITPDLVKAAVGEVQLGLSVSCSRALPTQPGPENPLPVAHHMIGTASEGYGADYVAISPHGYATTHIDALCHVFQKGSLYNNYPTSAVTAKGATELGIQHLRDGLITRGILIDVPPVRGVEALQPGEPIFPEDLENAEEQTGVRVGTGDALLIRTGRWKWREVHGPWDPRTSISGLDASCLEWLHERRIAALGSDGASDVRPSRVIGEPMPIHSVAIASMGLHLLDNLDLERLSQTCTSISRWSFLLMVSPLVLEGERDHR